MSTPPAPSSAESAERSAPSSAESSPPRCAESTDAERGARGHVSSAVPSRRDVLGTVGAGVVALLAGCSDASPRTPPPSETATPPATRSTTGSTPSTTTARRPATSTSTTRSSAPTTAQSARRVLYLYGDVSAEGRVPSGNAEPFHQMRLTDTGARGLSSFRAALEAVGFAPEERYDAATTLSASLLDAFDVLILGSNQHRFDADERRAVGDWVEAGGGLVAWSDSAFGGDFREVGVCNPAGRRSNNDLTEQFGMRFLRDNGAGNYRIREYTRDHFINADDADGGVVFRGEGVSCVRISGPATMLARLQAGGLNGELRVCSQDGPYQPDRDAALAVATAGDGRVVGTFDRNTFWNGGGGTNITQVDNRSYAQRLVRWAGGAG